MPQCHFASKLPRIGGLNPQDAFELSVFSSNSRSTTTRPAAAGRVVTAAAGVCESARERTRILNRLRIPFKSEAWTTVDDPTVVTNKLIKAQISLL